MRRPLSIAIMDFIATVDEDSEPELWRSSRIRNLDPSIEGYVEGDFNSDACVE